MVLAALALNRSDPGDNKYGPDLTAQLQSSTSTGKGILQIVLMSLGYVAVAIGCLVLWFSLNKSQWMAQSAEDRAMGQSWGLALDEDCLKKAISVHLQDGDDSLGGIMHAISKLTGCLASSKPKAGFCSEVPHMSDTMAVSGWIIQECAQFGASDYQCASLLQTVSRYCEDPEAFKLPAQSEHQTPDAKFTHIGDGSFTKQ